MLDRFLAVAALASVLSIVALCWGPVSECFSAMLPDEELASTLPVRPADQSAVRVSTANDATSGPTTPTVTSVTARQRTDGSKLVDIYYTVTNNPPSLSLISVDVSIDNVYTSYPVYLSGEFGSYILPGQRHVIWDAGSELPGVSGNYRARVRASQTGNYYNYHERVSSYFPINNSAGAPAPVPSRGRSSHSTGSKILKGQLHCHRYSDFTSAESQAYTPEFVAGMYRGKYYDFLALTEHHFKPNAISPEALSDTWQGWAPNSVELTYGNPNPLAGPILNDSHVLAIGLPEGTGLGDITYPTVYTGGLPVVVNGNVINSDIVQSTAERVKRIKQRGGLAYVAHPDSWPYNITPGQLSKVYSRSSPNGIGIWTPGNNSQRTWDKLVYDLQCPVYGIVEDDFHPRYEGRWGKTWVAVPGYDGEWWGHIKDKLRIGNFYCYYAENGKWTSSTFPGIDVNVSDSDGKAKISATFTESMNSIQFIGYKNGFFQKLQQEGSGTYAQYTATGRERFVRVMARKNTSDCELWVTSQPITISKTGRVSSNLYSSSMQIAAISPELELTYVEASEIAATPSAGYVGDVVEVTTADGQLPPNAMLALSFDGEDLSAIGGTQFLAIYRYDDAVQEWVKVGGTADFASATIESPITQLGKYCISADLPEDTESPTVAITAPQANASISYNTTVSANVNDNLGVWRVSFYVNDHLVFEDANASDAWSVTIPYTDYCTGDYVLKAVAEDLAGNRGEAEIPTHIVSSTPRPTVAITAPSAGLVLSGLVTATGTCWDDAAVASVTLKAGNTIVGTAEINGGNWTCDIDTTRFANGNRTLTAIVEDYPGNSATASVPVVFNGGALNSIGTIKTIQDGQLVGFGNAVVVATNATVGNGFYAETLDRASGIRVVTDQAAYVGDIVSVSGVAATDDGERTVNATDVAVISSSNDLPRPLFVRGSDILGVAPDSIGKIVKVFGRVGAIDPSNPARWFMLDDPSGVSIKCMLPEGVTTTPGLESISVTGVASFEESEGNIYPKIFMMSPGATITGIIGQPGIQSINQVVESPHPYPYYCNNTWTISGPAGTSRIRVHFTNIQTETWCDYLYVTNAVGSVSQTYYGSHSDVWSPWVSGDTIKLQLTSDGWQNYYGFKVDRYEIETAATPIPGVTVTLTPGPRTVTTLADGSYRFDGLPAGSYTVTPSLAGKTFAPSNRSISVTNNQLLKDVNFLINTSKLRGMVTQRTYTTADHTLESDHPYSDYYNHTWTVNGPVNAAKIRVHFNKIELESGYDFLYILDSQGYTNQIFNKGTPFNDIWSDWVNGNQLQINLATDSSINYYGFQIDKYEVEFQNEPVAGVTLTLIPGNLTVTSLADGSYLFDSLAAGNYVITPSLAGATFTPSSRSATVLQSQDVSGVNFIKN